MKKFIVVVSSIIVLLLIVDAAYFRLGLYIDFSPDAPVTSFIRTEGKQICMNRGAGYEPFEIRGVNMGPGIPGEWATDFKIDKATYQRWFKLMQEMGANTLRIYTVQNDTFYNAFYEYNLNNPEPLWLIHGVWVNDYVQFSHRDAYDKDFIDTFLSNSKDMIDVVHGNKKISMGRMASAGSGTYRKDISPWVIGYILGVEWEDVTVAYTDDKYSDNEKYNSYHGKYMYTSEEATPFEAMLAHVGDKVIEYETNRYKQQRIVAFSNWPTTDPFDYPPRIADFFMKCAKVNVENIKCTEAFSPGQFVSYHVYPYYPDYLNYESDLSFFGIRDVTDFLTADGGLNTYKAYLSLLTEHHTMPVVISEFGVSTGRGMAQRDANTNRNQGNMSEKEQGRALAECYRDIVDAGCAGCCVFTWQDEWFKRTWNTMYAVNLRRTPYWSDYQTNEQYFGLLSFDPGQERCVSYVDGDLSEWQPQDIVLTGKEGSVSVKYDERFIYFMIHKPGFDAERDKLYIPLDITPKSGSSYCENYELLFERAADFLIVLDGKDNSRVLVQERYEALRSTYSLYVYNFDTYVQGNIPELYSPRFVEINMILQTATALIHDDPAALSEVFETGRLRYGNANPESEDFDSLADFCINGDSIEVKLPWQLLNFADPSRMTIHDDYYDGNYGVSYISIDKMYVGLCDADSPRRARFGEVALEGWGNDVTYHERLKDSYYVLQELWGENDEG